MNNTTLTIGIAAAGGLGFLAYNEPALYIGKLWWILIGAAIAAVVLANTYLAGRIRAIQDVLRTINTEEVSKLPDLIPFETADQVRVGGVVLAIYATALLLLSHWLSSA